jgi:hypothetical protein
MKTRTSQILFGYWNDVRQGRLAPRRFDIEPARIAGILSETMILELADSGELRFRLAGTRITEIFAEELRGRSFLELWNAEDRATLERKLAAVRDQGGTLRLEFEASAGNDRHVTLEAVLMPLIHTRDVIDRFLGSIAPLSHPHWLGTTPLTSLQVLAAEIVWPEGRPHAVAEHMQPPALGDQASAGRIVRFNRRQFRVLDGGRLQSEDRS